jgi:hypothetical protein
MRGLGSFARAAAVGPVQGGASSRFALAAGAVSLLGATLNPPSEGGRESGRDDHVLLWVVVLVIALALAMVIAAIVALRRGRAPAQQDRRLETPEAGSSQSGPGSLAFVHPSS